MSKLFEVFQQKLFFLSRGPQGTVVLDCDLLVFPYFAFMVENAFVCWEVVVHFEHDYVSQTDGDFLRLHLRWSYSNMI